MGLFDFLGDDDVKIKEVARPDTSAVIQGGNEADRRMTELSNRVLADNDRFYTDNMAVAKPVADAQLGLMRQSQAQGADYFDYMKGTARPVETAAASEALAAGSPEQQEIAAGRAMADARTGTTQQQNQMFRQGLRYGFAPSRMKAMLAESEVGNASTIASAGNNARELERDKGFGKKIEAARMLSYLPSATNASTALSLDAGGRAVSTTMAPGAAKTAGTVAGANLAGQGLGMKQAGLNAALGADTSFAGMQNQTSIAQANFDSQPSGLGQLAGMALGGWAGGGFKMPKFG